MLRNKIVTYCGFQNSVDFFTIVFMSYHKHKDASTFKKESKYV